MDALLATSDRINRVLHVIGMIAGWLFVVCAVVICFDVISRKAGFQIPGLGSTRLQELEWHLHTALFCFWLGAAYIANAHVRIDIALTRASPRTHAMIELLGCIFFAVPYCLLAIYFSGVFTKIAWTLNEMSESPTGLPYRWVPKAFITAGLVLLLLAVFSVMMRVAVFLWGPESLRAASSFAGAQSAGQSS